MRRCPARAHALARLCRAVVPCAACPAPWTCGEHGTRTGVSRAGAARSLTPRPQLVWPGVSAQACLSRRSPVWGWSHRLRLASAGEAPRRRPPLPPSRRRGRSRAAGPRPVRWAEPGGLWVDVGGSRARTAGVPPASAGGEGHGALSGVALRASPTYAGGGGRSVSQRYPVRRVSPVRRGRGCACAPGCPAGGGATGQRGQARPGLGGAAGPNNALEPTPPAFARASLRLVARLTAGVRLFESCAV